MFHHNSPPVEAFAIGLGAGLLYGTLGYAANRRQTGEPFDPIHYVSSLAVAVVVSVGLSLSGVNPTEAHIAEQMAAYAGLTYVIERVLRAVIPPEHQRRVTERDARTEYGRR